MKQELDRIESLEKYVKQHSKEIYNLAHSSSIMHEGKVDSVKYEREYAAISELVKTLKFATQDTYRTLLATDNFIEKYLPYKMQEIVTENFKATFHEYHPEFLTK